MTSRSISLRKMERSAQATISGRCVQGPLRVRWWRRGSAPGMFLYDHVLGPGPADFTPISRSQARALLAL